jgi:peptide/nickel transport system permease protein
LLTWGSTDINSVNSTIRNEKDKPIVAFATSLNDIITLRNDNSVAIFGLPGGVATAGSSQQEKAMLQEFRKPLSQRSGEYAVTVKFIGITDKNGIIVTEDNKIFTWGDPTTGLNDVPAALQGKNIIDLQTGLRHYAVLTSEGEVITWGQNELNQLNLPKSVSNIDKLFADYFQNYAVREDGRIFSWGNKGYLFGTDSEGRSLLIRLIQGGKVSMTVGAISVLISITIGSVIGLISGFYGGAIDNVLMRFGEIVNAFPFLPLAITLSAFIGTDMSADNKMYLIMVILGVLSWPGLSRLIRGQILSEREKDFVTAAKALGIREKHIILRHILPSVVNIIIVDATLSYAGSLLTEAGLSFLGFGVQKPYPSWGNLLDDAKKMETIEFYWWKWILPALCIVIAALSINLVGDGLREAMDPKSNER